jgi:lipopolysaccharide transport system ATP-binding protein
MGQRACLPQPILRHILARHAFEHRAGGRTRGQEDVRHHYRKGVAGDWRNYFTSRVTAEFKARYGDLLIRLGYESSLDW